MNNEESQLRTEEEVHLRDYLQVINKRRTLVVAVFAVIFVLVTLYTFSRTPLYRGTTKVLIEKSTTSELNDNMASRGYDPVFYETQFQLIKSRAVAKRVVETLEPGRHSCREQRRRSRGPALVDLRLVRFGLKIWSKG